MFAYERPLDLRQGHALAIECVIPLRTDFQRPEILFPQRSVRFAARRQFQLEPLLEERRGDDEDDEQHERQVEQRRDVDVAQRHQRTALREAAHLSIEGRKSRVESLNSSLRFRRWALDTGHSTHLQVIHLWRETLHLRHGGIRFPFWRRVPGRNYPDQRSTRVGCAPASCSQTWRE